MNVGNAMDRFRLRLDDSRISYGARGPTCRVFVLRVLKKTTGLMPEGPL